MTVPASIDKEIKSFKKQIETLGVPELLTYINFSIEDKKMDILVFSEEQYLSQPINEALNSFSFESEVNIEKIIKNKFWQNFNSILLRPEDLLQKEILPVLNKFPILIIMGSENEIIDHKGAKILPPHQSADYYVDHIKEWLDAKELNSTNYKKELESHFQQCFNYLDDNLKKLVTEYRLRAKMSNAKKNNDEVDNFNSALQNIKVKYLAYIAQFEKLYLESFQERYHNTMGAKLVDFEELIDNTLNLAEEKQTKKSRITITDDNINKYYSDLEKDISIFFDTLAQSRNSYFENMTKELKQKLHDDGINYLPNSLTFNDIPIKTKLRDYISNTKNDFEHFIPKKRLMDYFSGSRQYVMIVIMMISLFGLRNVLNKNSEIYFPAIIILLGLGTYGIINQSKVEDQEARKKAMDSAKAHVVSELKNKIGNIDSILQKHFLKDVKEQINEIFSKVETEAKNKQKDNSTTSYTSSFSSSPERISEKLQDLLLKSSETKERIRLLIADIK